LDYLGLLIHAALLLRRYENSIIREQVDPLFEALTREIAIATKGRPDLIGYYATGSKRTTAAQLGGIDQARIQKVLDLVYTRLEERAGADIAHVAANHASKLDAAIEHRAPARQPASQPDIKAARLTRAEEILKNDSFDGSHWARANEILKERTARDTAVHTALSRNAGESPAELRARLQKFVVQPSQLRARALTRTWTLNVSNALAWEEAETNPAVKGYRLLVTLDGRTSLICIAYSAEHKFYLFVPGNPRPPFHFQCRTIIYPVIKGHEKEQPRDAEAWLKKKSAAEQDELLGPERAQMWRDGEITLGGLINSENRVLDLPELRGVSSSTGLSTPPPPPLSVSGAVRKKVDEFSIPTPTIELAPIEKGFKLAPEYIAEETRGIAAKLKTLYPDLEDRWRGRVLQAGPEHEDMALGPNWAAVKLWSCDVGVAEAKIAWASPELRAQWLTHELLHARSKGMTPAAYIKWTGWEEGTVEGLARRIADPYSKLDLEGQSYSRYIDALDEMHLLTRDVHGLTFREWLDRMLRTELPERYALVRGEVARLPLAEEMGYFKIFEEHVSRLGTVPDTFSF
jgi:hypothetical protein